MTTASRPARLSLVNACPHPVELGAFVLSVIAKRTYVLQPNVVADSPTQEALIEEQIPMPGKAALARDPDIVMSRGMTDIVVEGHAYASQHDDASVGAAVGGFSRRARVFGERRCALSSDGRILVSPETSFEPVPLTWDSAYGGVDQAALESGGDLLESTMRRMGLKYRPENGSFAYPRNRVGRGYVTSRTRPSIDSCRLPLIEPAVGSAGVFILDGPLSWPTAPHPVSFGWMPMNFFPRSSMIGLPTPPWDTQGIAPESFLELRAGLLPKEATSPGFRPRAPITSSATQSAAPGMQAADVSPDAAITLDHLHPRHARLGTRLPGITPKMVLRLSGAEPQDLVARIRTVHIKPDEDRISLVWVGEQVVRSPHVLDTIEEAQHAVIW